MSAERPHITGLGDGGLLKLGIHIEVIVFGFLAVIKELRQLLLFKSGKGKVEGVCLQGFDLHAEKLLVPSGIESHTVVGDNVSLLLGFGKVVCKHARHFFDAFLTSRDSSAVSGDDAVVAVDDDGIDKTELTERRAELVDLHRGMGTGIVLIGYQFIQRYELKFGSSIHRTSPHSANFSKPPIFLIYARAISTISP